MPTMPQSSMAESPRENAWPCSLGGKNSITPDSQNDSSQLWASVSLFIQKRAVSPVLHVHTATMCMILDKKQVRKMWLDAFIPVRGSTC